ncbi:hypothetical protein BDN67DRAFT_968422 [Paxillus ammoniavirescens]|nr:hypothetical protein BDN67DRAFT_968422 [Paxillus ammoniavirescens]
MSSMRTYPKYSPGPPAWPFQFIAILRQQNQKEVPEILLGEGGSVLGILLPCYYMINIQLVAVSEKIYGSRGKLEGDIHLTIIERVGVTLPDSHFAMFSVQLLLRGPWLEWRYVCLELSRMHHRAFITLEHVPIGAQCRNDPNFQLTRAR